MQQPSLGGRHPHGPAPVEYLPALTQILAAEKPGYRTAIVRRLERVSPGDDAAITALVRMALYDPEPSVRSAAVKALKRESPGRYGPKLIEAFRHPWQHVAEHAADAIVAYGFGRVDARAGRFPRRARPGGATFEP